MVDSLFTARPIEWRIPIGCDFSGFFVEVALGFIPALRPVIAELYLLQTRCPDSFLGLLPSEEAEAYLGSQVADADRSVAETAASIVIEHGNPCLMRKFERRPFHVVARVMSEGLLPQDQLQCAAQADSLWVPTRWHAKLFAGQGVPTHKLHIVPEVVDTRLFKPTPPVRVGVDNAGGVQASFTFLSVFKWERRKGWDVLLSAYWREFQRSEGTVLKLRTYKPSWEPGPDRIQDWLVGFARRQMKTAMSELPRVEVLPELSRSDLAATYSRSDAFVLPSRGEGWCLPCMEAMASALPIIVTNYSGPAAFINDENSFPLKMTSVDQYTLQAEPSTAHLRRQMRHVFSHPADAAAVGRRARADILERFSAERVAGHVLDELERITAATPDSRRG